MDLNHISMFSFVPKGALDGNKNWDYHDIIVLEHLSLSQQQVIIYVRNIDHLTRLSVGQKKKSQFLLWQTILINCYIIEITSTQNSFTSDTTVDKLTGCYELLTNNCILKAGYCIF